MITLHNYEVFLKDTVTVVEIFTYTISVIIISLSIIYSIGIYFYEFRYPEKAFDDIRLYLGESISLALSFILAVEILKVFYIKTYKQLVIVVSLTLLKLVINHYLLNEIDRVIKGKKN